VPRSCVGAIVRAAHCGPPHERDIPIRDYWAILLDAGRPQSGEAVAINRTLPGEKFFDRQHIAAAGFFEREEPAANGCNHFGLATNHPARRPWRWEVCKCQRATVGPDNMLPWAVRFGHVVLLCEKPN
jgi:hypothetical protein